VHQYAANKLVAHLVCIEVTYDPHCFRFCQRDQLNGISKAETTNSSTSSLSVAVEEHRVVNQPQNQPGYAPDAEENDGDVDENMYENEEDTDADADSAAVAAAPAAAADDDDDGSKDYQYAAKAPALVKSGSDNNDYGGGYDDNDDDGNSMQPEPRRVMPQNAEGPRPADGVGDHGVTSTTQVMSVSALPLTPVHKQRLQHLTDRCVERQRSSGGNSSIWTTDVNIIGDNLFVNDRLRFVYCLVPKVACTTWSRVLLIASGAYAGLLPNDLPQSLVNEERRFGSTLKR
jgi:hypothetical protein